MGRNLLQDVANTLPHMIMSERMGHVDLEKLAELPDGSLQIDLLTCEARHSAGKTVSLQVVRDLADWLKNRLVSRDQIKGNLAEAALELAFRTDAVPTDRKRAILLDWNCSCRLTTREGKAKIGYANGRAWYDRDKCTPSR